MPAAQMMIPQVNKQEAANYGKQWTHNGLAIPLSDVHIDFATDFANIVLKNFVMYCQQQAMAAQAQALKEQPKEATPSLIVEA